MSLTVYGSSQCGACKTLLKMAEAQKVEVTYKVIDEDPEARAEYEALGLESRMLPAAKVELAKGSIITASLQMCIPLLKIAKENSREG